MHAQLASAESRAATAEAQARRQANQIKGMRWQLQCMHQAITKNKTKIRKLQAIANASSYVDLGSGVFDAGASNQSFKGGSSAERMQKSRGVKRAVQAIIVHCDKSKSKAAEIVDAILNNEMIQQCYDKPETDKVAYICIIQPHSLIHSLIPSFLHFEACAGDCDRACKEHRVTA